MLTRHLNLLKLCAVTTFAVITLCRLGMGQEATLALLEPTALGGAPVTRSFESAPVHHLPPHRFWDRANGFLFAGVAAFSAADFVITRDNLRGGGRELNPITGMFSGSTAGLAVNFAGETAGVVSLSYVFHRTGHHRLERWVSMLNIGSSAAAVSFDLAHR